jgi:hypothetical protein
VILKLPLANWPVALGFTIKLIGALGIVSVADGVIDTENSESVVLAANTLLQKMPEPITAAPTIPSMTLFLLSISLLYHKNKKQDPFGPCFSDRF